MAGYGLNDDDFDEFLESSDDELIVVAPAAAPPPAVPPKLQWVLAATSFQGPLEGAAGDACRLVPPNRSARRLYSMLLWHASTVPPVGAAANASHAQACMMLTRSTCRSTVVI